METVEKKDLTWQSDGGGLKIIFLKCLLFDSLLTLFVELQLLAAG